MLQKQVSGQIAESQQKSIFWNSRLMNGEQTEETNQNKIITEFFWPVEERMQGEKTDCFKEDNSREVGKQNCNPLMIGQRTMGLNSRKIFLFVENSAV